MAEAPSLAAGEAADKVVETTQTPKIKYDWYQTDTHIVIAILARNTRQEEVTTDFDEDKLQVTVQLPDGSTYNLKLNLMYPIVPAQSTYRVIPSKIEVRLKKRDGIRWTNLECDETAPIVPQPMPEVAAVASGPLKYPSSAINATNWDQLVTELSKEEKEEKPEGEAALNALFQKIYSQGSDEVKRAMNKSFQESGGTVLSTNWKEVAREKVGVKAPDGMEWRKWDE